MLRNFPGIELVEVDEVQDTAAHVQGADVLVIANPRGNQGGKLAAAQIPTALVGSVSYQGTWNANTNSPALSSGTNPCCWPLTPMATTSPAAALASLSAARTAFDVASRQMCGCCSLAPGGKPSMSP